MQTALGDSAVRVIIGHELYVDRLIEQAYF
jgi:hypothetical protein